MPPPGKPGAWAGGVTAAGSQLRQRSSCLPSLLTFPRVSRLCLAGGGQQLALLSLLPFSSEEPA